MSLENKIEQLNETMLKLIEALSNKSDAVNINKVKAPELPVESFIDAHKIVEQVIKDDKTTTTETSITKADILEAAKVKLTAGKTTKEEIKHIITTCGFESLGDVKEQSDFETILTRIKVL